MTLAATTWVRAVGIAGDDGIGMLLHVVEEICVVDDAGLDGLLQSGAEFAWREGAEEVGVDEDSLRMVEAADEIFSGGEVDAGLAADGGVDLSEEGGGDLHVADAAHVDGGEEAGDVADDSAAEGDEEGVAVGSGEGELLGEGFDAGEALVALAAGEEEDCRSVVFILGKTARNGFDQRAQMSGEVMTKGRTGLPLLSFFQARREGV